MPVQELERDYLPTSIKSAEIKSLQSLQEVNLAPNVGRNSRLEGTGFNLFLELNRLYKNYNQNLEDGKSQEEAWAISVEEAEVNIRTFIVEYIQTKTVLPHVNRIEEINGVRRMVGNNGVPVVDGITNQERQGGVKQASDKVEEFISAEVPNRVAVLNSPLGHSGLFKQNGAEINYKNNQIMVFWTDPFNRLHGVTLVTDLDENQSKQLSLSLDVSADLLIGQTQLDRISNIVRNPALFSYTQLLKNPVEYVLDKVIAIRGNSDFKLAQEDGTIEYRSVAQTRQDIQRMDQLLAFSGEIEDRIHKLKNNLLKKAGNLKHSIIQAEIARAIEETILEITVDYLTQHPRYFKYTGNINNLQNSDSSQKSGLDSSRTDRFMVAAAFLRTRAGCAGGSGSSRVSLRGISLGLSIAGSGFVSVEGGGVCSCGRSTSDGHYHCPDCDLEYANETNVAPENRTKSCGCGFEFGCGGSGGKEEEQIELPKAA